MESEPQYGNESDTAGHTDVLATSQTEWRSWDEAIMDFLCFFLDIDVPKGLDRAESLSQDQPRGLERVWIFDFERDQPLGDFILCSVTYSLA